MKKINFKKEEGFTLLFAVLVSSLVLAVGASIITIALKQVVLSGVGRDSQYAFYASNTGIECALYWDLAGNNVFATSSDDASVLGSGNCIDNSISISSGDIEVHTVEGLPGATSEFEILFSEVLDGQVINYSADVYVTKQQIEEGGRKRIQTTILSRGYNTWDENNARRIERGLELTY